MIKPTWLLLGLEGLGVRAVGRRADGTRVVEVITTDPNALSGLRHLLDLGKGLRGHHPAGHPLRG